jgi:hypothetical protein
MDHLHLDRIDKAWKPREYWVQNGLEAFRLALALRDRHRLPFIVALGISLQSGDHRTNIAFRNPEELNEKLDWTPPSLYLFEPGKTPRTDTTGSSIHELRLDFFGEAVRPANCYYLEFRQPQTTEYSRSVFLEA